MSNNNPKFEQIVSDMLSNASAIAKNGDFSHEFRSTKIEELRQRNLQKLQELGRAEIDKLTAQHNQLSKLSKAQIAPSVGEASQLMYVKAVLDAKYAAIANNDERFTHIRQDWQDALEGDDLVTARLLRDFYPAFHDLVAATNEKVVPEPTRKAQEALKPVETALLMLQGDLNEAMLKVEHSKFNSDGTVVDGLMVNYQNELRHSF